MTFLATFGSEANRGFMLSLLAAVVMAAATLPASGQARTVDASISVSPVETLRLGDFDPANPSAAPLIFTVTVRADDTSRRLTAVVRVIGDRTGPLGTTTADLGVVPPLTTVVLTNRDFDRYELADAASDVIQYAAERGVLPPDDYRFLLTVFEESDEVLAEDEDFTTTGNGSGHTLALSPGSPLDEAPEVIDTPQPVFLWQSDAASFEFALFEVLTDAASPEDIATGLPVFRQTNVDQTTFAYPSYAEALKPGMTYAWLVQSIVATAAGSERVPSEMLWFKLRPSDGESRGFVTPGLTSIRVEPQEYELAPSGAVQLSAEGVGADGESLGPLDVTWQVVPTSGGEVTSTGLFTASASSGVVAVVAEREDLSDFATITVARSSREPGSRDSAYVVMLAPSEAQVLLEPAPSFSWQVVNADSSDAYRFRLTVYLVDEDGGGIEPEWTRDVIQSTSMSYPADEAPLESGSRYQATVAILDLAGNETTVSEPVEFALNRDPKISWELYNAWDEAQRTATDTLDVTMLVLLAEEQLSTAMRDRIAGVGATIEIAEGPWLQLMVPFASLPALAGLQEIRMMTLPSPHVLFNRGATEASDATALSSAHVAPLHESDERFAPIDVAIFEFGFDRAAVEELVDASRIRYHTFRRDGRIEGTGGADALHGVATLKAMVDYLPSNATIHLVNFDTEPEFQQALRYAVQELEAKVITCSVSWANAYDDYDGTSFFSRAVTETLGTSAVLVVAAGNFAESHWEAEFSDANGDGAHDFSTGTSYLELELNSAQRYDFLLSWDEWTAPVRDLDFELLDDSGEPLFDRFGRPYASRNVQTDGKFVEPLERIRAFRPPFAGKHPYRLRVVSATPDKTRESPPQFELYVYPPPVQSAPAADPTSSLASGLATTRSPAVVPVGAAGFSHSSRGPTNDGRVRPDFSTDGTVQLADRRFQGTSFATPRVAAALGSVLSRHPDWSVEQAVDYLRQFVAPDGPEAKDNVLGWGALDLRAVLSSL